MTCQVCQGNDHRELSCHLLWRTFNPDANSIKKVRQLPVSCYNCGSNLHFGLECQLQRVDGPIKSNWTSFSWENARRFIDYGSANVGISLLAPPQIKERIRARQQPRPSELTKNDDDPVQFIRPSVIRDDGRASHIRFDNLEFRRAPSPRTRDFGDRPVSPHYAYGGVRMDDRKSSSYRPGPANSNGPGYPTYDGPRQGHGPVISRNQESNYPSRRDSWQRPPPDHPPAYNDQRSMQNRSRRDTQVIYQPMPSAADKAWKKRRL